jgi:glycosyltransferase involved in cell wall biosynthesis
MQAVDAVAELRRRGFAPRLVVRGGREDYGRDVFARARSLGLSVEDVVVESREPPALFDALAKSRADVVNVRTFLSPATLYSLYAAADAVLANSGKEPFGLVGLEVMAAGGLAVLGATGEEYAEPFVNAIVCDTGDGRELAAYLAPVVGDPIEMGKIREAGRETARRCTWPSVVRTLEHKLAFLEST